MKENIIIENFGGIEYIDLELNKINLLIGPQASGKSITSKLLYFCKSIYPEAINAAENHKSITEFNNQFIKKFEDYFPINSWPTKDFRITYNIGDFQIQISKTLKGKLAIKYGEILKKEIKRFRHLHEKLSEKYTNDDDFEFYTHTYEIRSKFTNSIQNIIGTPAAYSQFFIPAGRSFFANLQSGIFSFLSSNKAIDPFLIEFGSFYESMKNITQRKTAKKKDNAAIDNMIVELLRGKYFHEKGTDYLLHKDNRKINVAYASSGQQETLPLAIILNAITQVRFSGNGATLYIEEPEAHLFPRAQKMIVELITTVFNSTNNNFQFFITTHSPYILSSFNNLLHGGDIYENYPEKRDDLMRLLPKEKLLFPATTNAFSIDRGVLTNIKCSETNLISQTILDSVSNEIAIQFDNLLDL